MALHYVFQLPEDKIIWDVGHQSYTHKILTGRKDGFDQLRDAGRHERISKNAVKVPVMRLIQGIAPLPFQQEWAMYVPEICRSRITM